MRGIWLVIAGVLTVIGLGVGVEAANTATLYGPQGARFTAAFPTAPVVQITRSDGRDAYSYTAATFDERLTVSATVTSIRPAPRGSATYGGGSSGSFASSVSLVLARATRGRSAISGPQWPSGSISVHRVTLNGLTAFLGIHCGRAAAGDQVTCVGTESTVRSPVSASAAGRVGQLFAVATTYSALETKALLESVFPVELAG